MGGTGSGAPRYRRIAEETRRIDIRDWRRRGYLGITRHFIWSWSIDGEQVASIGVAIAHDSITLSYSIMGDEPTAVSERIPLRIRPCRFGGWRKYFVCPTCPRSAEVLYLARGRFVCRKCARIGYSIENLEKQWRADRRYRQLETRLNDDGTKPLRMRWATYRRICGWLEKYGEVTDAGMTRAMARLLRRYPGTEI